MHEQYPWRTKLLAEFVGTFILVFFGCGAVAAGVVIGSLAGMLQVALTWAIAIAIAIYAVGHISGAHINPAITVAFALHRGFPWRWVPGYFAAQGLGAFAAAGVLYLLLSGSIAAFEADHVLSRGDVGSEHSAMVFCDYFPNPDAVGTSPDAAGRVTWWQAMFGEIVGTALLAFAVFALTDPRNPGRPGGTLSAPFIGLTVAAIVVVLGPITMAGLNPARDFGPRLFAWLAGWDAVAIPGPRGGFFTVYILAPIIGGGLGGAVWHKVHPTPAPASTVLTSDD